MIPSKRPIWGFIVPWSQNRNFQTPQRCQFLNLYWSVFVPILTYSHEPWVMTERILSQMQAAEMRFFRRVHGVTLRDNVCSCEMRRTLNVQPRLLRVMRPSYIGSAMCTDSPAKEWRNTSGWLNPRESGPDVVQGPGGVATSPTLLSSVFVWSQQNYLKVLLTVTYSKSS